MHARKISYAVLIGSALILANPGDAIAAKGWSPTASEKLIKLPGDFLEKAVENDFRKSELAGKLSETEEKVVLKKDSLADLQAAIEGTDGELRTELEHQFLTEKKRYIELMREQTELRRARAKTKVRLYERLLKKITRKKGGNSKAQAQLVSNQHAARERFKGTLSQVDKQLFKPSVAAESRYSQEYAKNMTAIESLAAAISAHPMNQDPVQNGQPITQEQYVRQLIAQNEAEIALVDQERAVLGYMAKLVSLDALAMSEDLVEDETYADNATEQPDLTSAVDFFITN